MVLITASCSSSHHLQQESKMQLKKESNTGVYDSITHVVESTLERNIQSMKLWINDLNLDRKVVNYSLPDSSGRQYKISEENTRIASKTQGHESYNEQMKDSLNIMNKEIRKIISKINELETKEIIVSEKNLSWLDQLKIDYSGSIIITMLIIFIIGLILYKKKGDTKNTK